MKTRRKFTAEFKVGAVKLVLDEGMSRQKVANDLGICPSVLGKWVKDFQTDRERAFPGNGRLSPQDQKIRDLEKQVKNLKMERDILKKATAFFVNHGG